MGPRALKACQVGQWFKGTNTRKGKQHETSRGGGRKQHETSEKVIIPFGLSTGHPGVAGEMCHN